MSTYSGVRKIILSVVDIKVFPDYVPESEAKPAIAISNLANPHGRVLSGEKTGKKSSWRVTIVTKSVSELESLIEDIEKLDNTSKPGFKKIFASLVLKEPTQPGAIYRRAFVDLRIT